jgi:hypothetical protein
MDETPGLPPAVSFGIRLWPERTGPSTFEWRGRVRHLASQDTLYFRDLEALVAFLRDQLSAPESPLH